MMHSIVKRIDPVQKINKELPRRPTLGSSKPKKVEAGFAEALTAELKKGGS